MKYINNIDERIDSKQDLSFLLEGVMSDLHLLAKEVKTEDEFIKKFFKEHGDKVKKTPDSVEWVKSLYKDTIGESVNEKDKGLWANIRAKRARGEAPAKKGSKAYKKAKAAADEINDESVTEGKKEDKLIRAAEANLTKVLADLKDNLTKFKNAQTPEEKEKYKTEAGRLTKLRKAAQADLDSAIVNLHKDAELNIKENKMEHIKSFDYITEAKWKVLGSMGDFQVFPDKEKGDHIILLLGKGPDQMEHPIYLKKRDTADKLRDRYYHGKQINIKESLNEAFIGPFVFNDKMSDDKLKAMYDGALDGYANHQKGFQHAKSKYKEAYQAIEKILKKRGVKVDESKINESIMYQWLITEGQFSWLTQDRGEQIGSESRNTINVWMFDNKGNKWMEKRYEGYGEFGGMDYYDLVATMNGYKADRQIGIDLAFNKIKTKDKGRKTLFPALVGNPRFNWKQHDFTKEATSDPNQSWYTEDKYDVFNGEDDYRDGW